MLDVLAEEDRERFLSHWHDRAWSCDVGLPSRYVTAHYENDPNTLFAAGEALVVFDADASDGRIREAASSCSARVGSISRFPVNDGERCLALFYWDDLTADPLSNGQQVVNNVPEASWTSLNFIGAADSEEQLPADVANVGQQQYLTLSHFDDAWKAVKAEGSVSVAVLDSGIDMNHPDLSDCIDYSEAYDAIDRKRLPDSFEDVIGHGTVVSGVISAIAGNDIGICGCSYNANIVPVRVIDDADKLDLFVIGEGIGHLFDLDTKPDVVNMSFSFTASEWFTPALGAAWGLIAGGRIDELSRNYGMVFVASAGNDGEDGNLTSYPAALGNVISVASIDAVSMRRSSFSTANGTVDVCAVGNPVLSTTDPESEFGGGNYYADRYIRTASDGSGKPAPICGTSFSAPQVSAAAALLKKKDPSMSAADVKSRLVNSAQKLPAMGSYDRTDEYGHGLLDAAAAVGVPSSSDSGGSGSGHSPSSGIDSLGDLSLAFPSRSLDAAAGR